MSQGLNKSEKFVFHVCRETFLSLWSYANAKGKNNKELCDVLIVCDPDILIISVKEISSQNSGDIKVDTERWLKRAIESSVKQIYGAERWIQKATCIICHDSNKGLNFPDISERRVHRIAIALGSKGKFPIYFGDFGKGFVHVFDEISFNVLLKELDTITDFIMYLASKENLYRTGIETIFEGGEEDLLAIYLHYGRTFPKYDSLIIDDNLWSTFSVKAEYIAKKTADKDSYIWDRMIEILNEDILSGHIEFGNDINEAENAIRAMARENRFNRRILGKSVMEFYLLTRDKTIRSRMVKSPSGVLYIFLAVTHGEDRQFRLAELGGRCFVARGLHHDCPNIVGIATEQYKEGKGFSLLDVIYLSKTHWTNDDQVQMEYAQREFGFFKNPIKHATHEDEYPSS